jgi:hypothetical protein
MQTFRLSVPAGELTRRMRERLRGASTASKVVWQHKGQRILLHADQLQGKLLDGWIVCDLPVQTDQTGVEKLQFVYYVGKLGEADGLQAAGTVNAPTLEGAQLAEVFGASIERVLWDAVLDCLEGMVSYAATQKAGQKITLGGYHCNSDALGADILVGEL